MAEAHEYYSQDMQEGRLHLIAFLDEVIAYGFGRPVVLNWRQWLFTQNLTLRPDQPLLSSLPDDLWYKLSDIQLEGNLANPAPKFHVVEPCGKPDSDFYAQAGSFREPMDNLYTRLTEYFTIGYSHNHWRALCCPLAIPPEIFNSILEKAVARLKDWYETVKARNLEADPESFANRDRIPLPTDILTHVVLNSCPVALKTHQEIGMREVAQALEAVALEATSADILQALVSAVEICPSSKFCQLLLPIKPVFRSSPKRSFIGTHA
jgi:hypothetical protein